MAEYIKRDAVTKVLTDRYELVSDTDMLNTINAIPAEDVRKNTKGGWKDEGFLNRLTCSECGEWIGSYTGTVKLNYCPNCGANMELQLNRNEKLNPCENCGCLTPQLNKIRCGGSGYFVECPSCHWCAGTFRMRYKAIRKWNKLHFHKEEPS